MAKKDVPCTRCGDMMWRSKERADMPVCRPCRAKCPAPYRPRSNALPDRNCEGCGLALTRKQLSNRNRFCSLACANQTLPLRGIVVMPENSVSDPYGNQRKCAQRRARKAAAEIEVVEPLYIFERDNWRCHLCGKTVDRHLNGRHPLGPTLDHVIPLSRGGEHSRANVALAHRRCNTRKGNRAAGEQLALVG